MGQSRPLFLFIFVFSTCYNLNSNLNWKKHRWCAWESNPGWQDGRRKQIHWATAAPRVFNKLELLLTPNNWGFEFCQRQYLKKLQKDKTLDKAKLLKFRLWPSGQFWNKRSVVRITSIWLQFVCKKLKKFRNIRNFQFAQFLQQNVCCSLTTNHWTLEFSLTADNGCWWISWKASSPLYSFQPVWPDWAILKGLGNKFSFKIAQIFHNFLGNLKMSILIPNCCGCFLGYFRKQLGNFRKQLGYF